MELHETLEFPDQAGLMILPWASLFPGAMMPLKIFEERYQEMLAQTLAGNRMFAIAHTPALETHCDPLGCIGLIRACVKNEDGSSNLVLQGVSRVQFERVKLRPFPQSKMAVLCDPDESTEEMESFREKIMAAFRNQTSKKLGIPEGFVAHLDTITRHGAFTDLICSTVFENPQTRRLLFEQLDVVARMELLEHFLSTGTGE